MQASTEEVFEALGSTLRSFHVGDYSSAHSGGGGVGCCGAEEQRNLNSFAKMSAARDPRYDSNSSRLSEQLSPPLEQSFRRPLRKAEPLLLVDKSALDALLAYVQLLRYELDKSCLSMVKKEGKIQEIKGLWRRERDERRRLERLLKEGRGVMRERKSNANLTTLLSARQYLLNDKRPTTPQIVRPQTHTHVENPLNLTQPLDENVENSRPWVEEPSCATAISSKFASKRKISVSSYTPPPSRPVTEFSVCTTPELTSRRENQQHHPSGIEQRLRELRQSVCSRESKILERTLSSIDCRRSLKEDFACEEEVAAAMKLVGASEAQLERQFLKYFKGSAELDQLRRKSKKYKLMLEKMHELAVSAGGLTELEIAGRGTEVAERAGGAGARRALSEGQPGAALRAEDDGRARGAAQGRLARVTGEGEGAGVAGAAAAAQRGAPPQSPETLQDILID